MFLAFMLAISIEFLNFVTHFRIEKHSAVWWIVVQFVCLSILFSNDLIVRTFIGYNDRSSAGLAIDDEIMLALNEIMLATPSETERNRSGKERTLFFYVAFGIVLVFTEYLFTKISLPVGLDVDLAIWYSYSLLFAVILIGFAFMRVPGPDSRDRVRSHMEASPTTSNRMIRWLIVLGSVASAIGHLLSSLPMILSKVEGIIQFGL